MKKKTAMKICLIFAAIFAGLFFLGIFLGGAFAAAAGAQAGIAIGIGWCLFTGCLAMAFLSKSVRIERVVNEEKMPYRLASSAGFARNSRHSSL